MKDYSTLAKFILAEVGGKDNVIELQHCTTRLRFYLRNKNLANTEKIKNHQAVSGVTENSGQYQIIIGMDVSNVYKAIKNELGDLKYTEKVQEKKKLSERILGFISGIMGPIISYYIASGIITGVNALLLILGIIEPGGTITLLLNAFGNAVFYFFPFILGYSIMKKLNVEPALGILLAAVLCHPSINGVDLSVFNQTLNVTYTSTFLPIIFTCIIAKPIYEYFLKILPEVIRSFISITLTMLIAGALGFLVIGPLTNSLSGLIASGVLYLYEFSPIISGLVLGGCYQILVLFGLHSVLGLVTLDNIVAGNPDIIAGLIVSSIFACMFTALAMAIKTKSKSTKGKYFGGFISAIFGVSEPVIYGPLVNNPKIFAIVCISSGIGGALSGLWGIKLQSFAGMGVIGLVGYIDSDNPSIILKVGLTVLIVSIVSFILTLIVYRDKNKVDLVPIVENSDKELKLYSPVRGIKKATDTVEDATFSGDFLGKTIAIEPKEGMIYAPFSGKVEAVFPTKHAIGLVSDAGQEVLIHVGIDTVKLNGKYFDCLVNQGDVIAQGDLLLTFDLDEIKKAGYITDVIIIITNDDKFSDFESNHLTTSIDDNDLLLTSKERKNDEISK